MSRQESSPPPVRSQASGGTSAERTASDEAENKAEVKMTQSDAQIPAKLPSQSLGSGEAASTAVSKREESPPKSCTEEKRDKSKEEPRGGNKEEDVEGGLTVVGLKFTFLLFFSCTMCVQVLSRW